MILSKLLSPILGPTIDKVLDLIPDKNARNEAREELELRITEGIQAAANAQVELNKVEAASGQLFVAGARPFLLWVCGCGLGIAYVVNPVVAMAFGQEYQIDIENMPDMMDLIYGMLGLAGWRSFDKRNGVAREYMTFSGRKQ